MRYKNTDAVPIKEERDLVEVVRCKDCKHHNLKTKDYGLCEMLSVGMFLTDFCSYGERREK